MKNTLVIKNCTDIELFELMRDQAQEIKETGFEEFVNRYYNFISTYCYDKCYKHRIDDQEGHNIIYEVFESVKKYPQYDQNKSLQNSIKKGIELWLLRIASNKFNDYFNKKKKQRDNENAYVNFCSKYSSTSYEYGESIEPSEAEISRLENQRNVSMRILSVLNDKERMVFLKDLEVKRSKDDYMDRDVNAELANSLSVKTASIRKIRERANKKVNEEIAKFNNQSNE